MSSQHYRKHRSKFGFKLWQFKSLFAIAAISTLISCEQLDHVTPESNNSNENQRILTRTPSYIDDRLYFADFDEFKEYFLELDSLYDAVYKDIFDSIVLATTPVTVINNQVTSLSAAAQTYLSDPIMRAIVNPNYEFQIDDVLVTYINNSQIVASDISNTSAKSDIRALTKGIPLTLSNLPSGAYWSDPKDLEDALKIFCGCRLTIAQWGCDSLRFFGNCNAFFGADGEGSLTIQIVGDNPITIHQQDVDGPFEFFLNITLMDATLFSAWVDPDCGTANNATAQWLFSPEDLQACDPTYRSSGFETMTSGSERMIYQTSYYQNFWGWHHLAEIESRTLSGSNWNRSRADLRVLVDATALTPDCDFIDQEDDTKSCPNCRSLGVRVNFGFPVSHCDGDLIGEFRKIRSSITLTDTQSVDFNCCE